MTTTITIGEGYICWFRKGINDKLYSGKLQLPDGKELDGGNYPRQHVARAIKSARENGYLVTIK